MEIVRDKQFDEYRGPETALALGTFDGLHTGHQKVIDEAKKLASENFVASGVFSFTPHPRRVLNSGKGPGVICSRRQKREMLAEMDLDYYFSQEFTRDFSRTEFEEFIKKILWKKLKSRHLIVGEDFTFGYRGEGTCEDLRRFGKMLGFNVSIISAQKINGEKISSTKIRNMISRGRVDRVPEFLGRYYTLAGEVIHGSGRGRELGYPTANLRLEADYVLPRRGVYAGYVKHSGEKYRAAANFGENPTFSEENFRIEIYILDLDEDLYGKRLSFCPVEFIRPEKKFNSIKRLRRTIESDILYTKKVL